MVALLRRAGRSPTKYAELLDAGPSPIALLRSELMEDGGQRTLLPPDPEPLLAQAHADLERWKAAGYRVLTMLDEEYPRNLGEVHDRPPLIFVAGRLEERDERSIAIIGSRHATPAGLSAARELAHGFVAAGYVVLSGLAAGIDTAAHLATLAAGGRTMAVVGTGLAHAYPPENAALQQRLAAEGAVISQFWPETEPTRGTFPLRNAVMSGLARATVVVEASLRSGSRTQTRLALAHGRPVFLLRPVLSATWARELAAKPGVYVVDGAAEVIDTVERLRAMDELVD